jgi:hypothetical protein
LPDVSGNVLVIHEQILLSQISLFVAGRDLWATEAHPDIHLFSSGDSGSSGSPSGFYAGNNFHGATAGTAGLDVDTEHTL